MNRVAGDAEGAETPQAADSAQPDEAWSTVATQTDLEEMLHEYAKTRDEIARLESKQEGRRDLLKPWLEANQGQELRDDERGWRAYLQPTRRGPKPYDLPGIREKDPPLFKRLLDTGCLTVNAKAVQAQGAQVAGIEKYAGFVPVSYSLQVEKLP